MQDKNAPTESKYAEEKGIEIPSEAGVEAGMLTDVAASTTVQTAKPTAPTTHVAEAPSNGTEHARAHPDEETTETTAQAAKTADETDKTAAAPKELKSAVEEPRLVERGCDRVLLIVK